MHVCAGEGRGVHVCAGEGRGVHVCAGEGKGYVCVQTLVHIMLSMRFRAQLYATPKCKGEEPGSKYCSLLFATNI